MARSRQPAEAPPSTRRRHHPTSAELPDDIDDDHRFLVLHGVTGDGRFCVEGGGIQQPVWFFVPDTGTPGGSAVLTGPTGEHNCVETQITADVRTWPDGLEAPGLGFLVPAVFTVDGAYVLDVAQDDRTDRYGITVTHDPELDPVEAPVEEV